jgi:protein translocase SecG subunit
VLSFGRRSHRQESIPNVELILFIALVLTAVGLIASVLMQSRGSGLGATFGGGDSSTYRSRRGVEARLYQFTIILAILFVGICMIIYIASL